MYNDRVWITSRTEGVVGGFNPKQLVFWTWRVDKTTYKIFKTDLGTWVDYVIQVCFTSERGSVIGAMDIQATTLV